MDVAYYLSELLGQLGEVNVPGLGYFAKIRVDGYYNAADSTFYPPTNKVQFDPQIIDDDDDTLAQYIAEKKNISVASSRYFTEKYINALKQEAFMKDAPLADLGFLYIEGKNITFKPAEVMKNDPAVFGYAPLHLDKLEGPSFIHQMETYGQVTKEQLQLPEPDPAYQLPQHSQLTYDQVIQEAEAMLTPSTPEPAATPYVPPVQEPFTPQTEAYRPEPEPYIPPLNPEDQEEFVFHGKTYVPPNGRSYKWLWITLLVILGIFVVGVLGMLAIHKYKPALYNEIHGIVPEPVAVKAPIHTDSLKTDTLIKDTTIKKTPAVIVDSTAKDKPAASTTQSSDIPVIDSSKIRYELMVTSAETLPEANKYVKNFNSAGLTDAHVVIDAKKKKFNISVGTFSDRTAANKKKNELISAHKISSDAYLLTINPKQ